MFDIYCSQKGRSDRRQIIAGTMFEIKIKRNDLNISH